MDQLVKRLLKVALVGSPNVGKSTLLNKLVGSEISCVSNKVHTTRQNTLGVYTQGKVQLKFYDSPGIITREHLIKHRLEDSLYTDPAKAAVRCDMIVVVVDAGNVREKNRLNQGLIRLLNDHSDKKSVLVMNKVDLVKEKRELLDISTRLTQGCLNDRLRFDKRDIRRMQKDELQRLNLLAHVPGMLLDRNSPDIGAKQRPLHKYVIELKKSGGKQDDIDLRRSSNPKDENFDPNLMSYRNFSHIFSISATQNEGIDKLKNYLCDQALPVAEWPHGPSYLGNMNSRDIVHSIIRGRVMDEAKHSAPYTIGFRYERCDFDEVGSLHVNLKVICPEKYMVSMIIGDRGATISKMIDSARASISKTLGCDVKLDMQVEHAPNAKQTKVTFAKSRVPEYITTLDELSGNSGEDDDDDSFDLDPKKDYQLSQ